MEKRVITALFDTRQAAAEAVRRLKQAGVPDADISLIGRDAQQSGGTAGATTAGGTDDTSNTGAGATAGAVIGGGAGLLAGIGAMAIPGLGPVVAAGWLASTLVGAAAGGVTGSVVGALTEWGMSEEEAHTYAEGVRRGGTMVTARVDETLANTAANILGDEGHVDMSERSRSWRNEGWSGRYEPSREAAYHQGGAAIVPPPPPQTAAMPGSPGVAPGASVPRAGEPGIGQDVPARSSEVEIEDTREEQSRSVDAPRRKA